MFERKTGLIFLFLFFPGKQVKSISSSLQGEFYVYLFIYFFKLTAFSFLRWLKSVFAQLSDGHAELLAELFPLWTVASL